MAAVGSRSASIAPDTWSAETPPSVGLTRAAMSTSSVSASVPSWRLPSGYVGAFPCDNCDTLPPLSPSWLLPRLAQPNAIPWPSPTAPGTEVAICKGGHIGAGARLSRLGANAMPPRALLSTCHCALRSRSPTPVLFAPSSAAIWPTLGEPLAPPLLTSCGVAILRNGTGAAHACGWPPSQEARRRKPGKPGLSLGFADSTGADWLRLTGIGESDGEVTFGEAVEGGVAMAPSETADSWLEAGR